jgi:hypothetical protein
VAELARRPPHRRPVLVAVLAERDEWGFGRLVGAQRGDVGGVLEQWLVPVPELIAGVESFPDGEDAVDVAGLWLVFVLV